MSEPENKEQMVEVDIECPNCKIISKAGHNANEKRPVIYGKCNWCETLFKWTKCSTIEIISASRKQYLYITTNQ